MQNLSYENELYLHENTVADSDLQIRGGEQSSRPWDMGGGARSQKKKISALRTSVWSKNKGGGVGPRAPPLDPPFRNKRSFSDQWLPISPSFETEPRFGNGLLIDPFSSSIGMDRNSYFHGADFCVLGHCTHLWGATGIPFLCIVPVIWYTAVLNICTL